MMMYLHTEYISRQTILHPSHDRIISMYNIHYPATSKPQNSLHRNQTLKSGNSSNAFVSSERGTKERKQMLWLYDNKKVTVFPDAGLSDPCQCFFSCSECNRTCSTGKTLDKRCWLSWCGVHDTLNTFYECVTDTQGYRVLWQTGAHPQQRLGTAIQQSRRAAHAACVSVHFEQSARRLALH